MDLLPRYRALVASRDAMAHLCEARSPAMLFQRLRDAWGLDGVGDDALVAELNRCNREVLDGDAGALAGHWFPYRYHAASRSLAWCLPDGPATEPFQDEYIARCRQQLAGHFIQPRTAIAPLLATAPDPLPVPAGLVFHLSRCGSTLVSGCLSTLDDTTVLSEPPPMTEALLDTSLGDAPRRRLLQWLVALQAAPFPGRDRVVVKWNAWDLFAWPLIRDAFPGVPRLLLFRAPEEILASHARGAGRHMAGDPSLAPLSPVFSPGPADGTVLDQRIRVLRALMQAMAQLPEAPESLAFDYAQLDAPALEAICRHFRIPIDEAGAARMQARMAVHSKIPGQAFQPDAEAKRQWFDPEARQAIRQFLAAAYSDLGKRRGAGVSGPGPDPAGQAGYDQALRKPSGHP